MTGRLGRPAPPRGCCRLPLFSDALGELSVRKKSPSFFSFCSRVEGIREARAAKGVGKGRKFADDVETKLGPPLRVPRDARPATALGCLLCDRTPPKGLPVLRVEGAWVLLGLHSPDSPRFASRSLWRLFLERGRPSSPAEERNTSY